MAMVVHCACGYPLDVDQLGLVVSLTCPSCSNELDLEIELEGGQTGVATLSIVEGPHWVGEQFVMPVGQPLIIGEAENNWLRLHSDALADMHCRVKVADNGTLLLEDLQSDTGTWVGKQRVSRCRLAPRRAFSAGGYRFFYGLATSDATTIVTAAPHDTARRPKTPQTALGRIKRSDAWLHRQLANRFSIARTLSTVFSILMCVHLLIALSPKGIDKLTWPAASILSVGLGVAVFVSSRRIALGADPLRFITPGLLGFIAAIDILWEFNAAAAAAICFAVFLIVLLLRVTSESLLVTTGLIGSIGTLLLGGNCIAVIVRALL